MTSQNKLLVFKYLEKVPRGKVVTYKLLAVAAGIKNPRLVGSIIHKNTDPKKNPCHRVVKSDGTIAASYAFGGKSEQIKKLKEEGIEFTKNKINLSKFQITSSLL